MQHRQESSKNHLHQHGTTAMADTTRRRRWPMSGAGLSRGGAATNRMREKRWPCLAAEVGARYARTNGRCERRCRSSGPKEEATRKRRGSTYRSTEWQGLPYGGVGRGPSQAPKIKGPQPKYTSMYICSTYVYVLPIQASRSERPIGHRKEHRSGVYAKGKRVLIFQHAHARNQP
jgi:hypothetical protein